MTFVLNYASRLQVVEELAASGAVGQSQVIYSGYDRSDSIRSDATGPAVPVTKRAFLEQALTAGAATIDLTSLTHEQGGLTETVDGTGLKLQFLRLCAPSGNDAAITITPGASNGYDFSGSSASITLESGQCVTLELAESAPDIDSSNKTLDLAGTGTDSLEVSILMG